MYFQNKKTSSLFNISKFINKSISTIVPSLSPSTLTTPTTKMLSSGIKTTTRTLFTTTLETILTTTNNKSTTNSTTTIINSTISNNITNQLHPQQQLQSNTESTLLLILAFIAFIENLLVCLPIIYNPRIRTTINYFVLSLCLTQLLTDSFVIPLHCFAMQTVFYSYVVAFVVISYITNLLALTLDRYTAIKYPLRYRGIMWRGRCIRIIVACWVVSMLVQILPVFWHNSKDKLIIHKVYISSITGIFLLLPLCIVIFAYVNIFIEIVTSSKKDKRRRVTFRNSDVRLSIEFGGEERKISSSSIMSGVSAVSSPNGLSTSNTSLIRSINKKFNFQQQVEFRSAMIFFVIILMYGATWIPVLIMTIAGVMGKSHRIPKNMNVCAIYIMVANTMLDPLIYGWYMKDIRCELINMMRKTRRCIMRGRNTVLKANSPVLRYDES